MSKRTIFFVLAALFVITAGISLIVGPGWCHKAPSGGGVHARGESLGERAKVSSVAANAKAHALAAGLGRVPIYFVPNRGQADDRVDFYVQGDGKTIYFSPDGLTLTMRDPARTGSSDGPKRWTVKLDFLGARKDVKPQGLEETGAAISYFRGKPEEWKSGLPAYSRIIYHDLWPGIDLVYKGELDRLKYEFIVHPGADPSKIMLGYRGAERVALTGQGRLEVKTPVDTFKDDAPVAYQDSKIERLTIPVSYSLEAAAPVNGSPVFAYGFDVGAYDRDLPLVIDPAVLVYCGFIGGINDDGCHAVAVDGSGSVYVMGRAFSDASTFPVTVGPDLTPNTGTDAFVAKIDSSGANLVYCGYLGSASSWEDGGIAVDADGNAYVTGFTSSNESFFPVKVGPDLTYNGGIDAFVAKISASGTDLVYCGYIGGSAADTCQGIAVDAAGRAYVSGNTYSSQATFPEKVGPDLTYNGDMDAFVARISASGAALDYCGYIGGSGGELASGIAIDGAGCIYVSGHTGSSPATFPVKVGPALTSAGGGYVAKVESSGAGLVYCGYIEGTWWTWIAVDGSGCAYITGSANADLPVLIGPDLTFNGSEDAFVAKVNAAGSGLVYCGYIGGADSDAGWDIAVDSSGQAYIVGSTRSTADTFPVIGGPDVTHNGGSDGFIAKVDPSGTALIDCGYIGGTEEDGCSSVAIDELGKTYVCGTTRSSEASFPVLGGPDLIWNGGGDGFIAKLTDVPGPPITTLLPESADAGDPGFLLSVIGSEFVDGAVVRWDGSPRTTTFVSSSELQAAIDATDLVAGKIIYVTVQNPNGGISNALPFAIHNPLPSLSSISPTQVTGGGAAFTLTVQGSNFVPNSVVRWNGNARTTTYISAMEIQAAITGTDLATGGDVQVTVFNPAPSGGTSGSLVLPVSSYALASTPASVTVSAGQPATYTIQLTPQHGSFDSAVTFSCVGLPSKCTPSFAPVSVTPGAAVATTTLTLSTAASAAAAVSAASLAGTAGFGLPFAGLYALALVLLLASIVSKPAPRRLAHRRLAACALIAMAFIVIGSCSSGGDGNNPPPYTGTPKGSHTISVQATSGSMTVPTSITLVVN